VLELTNCCLCAPLAGRGYAPCLPLEHHLRRWVEAGLISSEQAGQIRSFEQSRERRPALLMAVAGLGGLAIAVGLLSIVAANWDDIPGRLKIGIDLILVAGLGVGIMRLERRGPTWALETAIVAFYGLVLASVALVGQVYQLGGKAHEALAVWSLLTAVIMSRARSGFAAAIWVLALQITCVIWSAWLSDEHHLEAPGLASLYWPPLVAVAVGHAPWVRRVRPALARVAARVGWVELVLCATLGTFAFYGDTAREDWSAGYPVMAISLVATLAIGARLCKTLAQRVLLVVCLVFSHIPVLVSPGDLDLLAAASFVVLWLGIAWVGNQARNARILNLATAMIGIRIVIIYFEVFGSLLDTGLGLLTGGVLTLGVVWLWARKRKRFEHDLQARKRGDDG
jgi:uncharacterized membrane protein